MLSAAKINELGEPRELGANLEIIVFFFKQYAKDEMQVLKFLCVSNISVH